MGLKGRLPIFLTEYVFNVRVSTTLSDLYYQEIGVPQGGILSVTLFNIKINDIVKCLKPGIDCSLYIDNFFIYYRSKNSHTIVPQ